MNRQKEYAKTLRAAAKLIVNGYALCCCYAITISDEIYIGTPKELFIKMFRQDAIELGHDNLYYFREVNEDSTSPEIKERRILGLLFCAHLVEIGDWEL